MADIQAIKNAQQSEESPSGQSATSAKSSGEALSIINRDLEEKNVQEHAADLNIPYIKIAEFPINPDILVIITLEAAKKASMIPFYKSGKNLKIAVTDPSQAETQAALKKLEESGYKLQIHLASQSGLAAALKLYASDQYKLKTEIKNIVKEEEINFEKELVTLAGLKERIETVAAEEALNMLNVSAIKAGASDIHYQPEEKTCTVRFRIDGVLHTVFEINLETFGSLANQLKYKAKMQMNTTTVPQDGRFRFIVNERNIDVRVSSLPTEFGESFVCRILDSGKHFGKFAELGFSGRALKILDEASGLTQGMVLVVGPTSSGKTTTLYVLLNQFNKPDVKIITLEDPIEYHLKYITQSQVDEKKGYTFDKGLKSILRQDPDVLMIGEIRGLETAQVCAQAALTGHVLLSTLHTNNAVETIPRLITIGLPPFMVAPALSVVVAQRLVRKLCSCAESRPITDDEKQMLEKVAAGISSVPGAAVTAIPSGLPLQKGCEQCNSTGFRGQMVISEVLSADNEIKDAILKNRTASEIFAMARAKGMTTMYEDAITKVLQGLTTLDEVHRVINA